MAASVNATAPAIRAIRNGFVILLLMLYGLLWRLLGVDGKGI